MDSLFPTRVILRQAVLETLSLHSEDSYPREACGVLLGTRTIESLTIDLATLGVNLSEDPGAFALDPGCVVAAEQEAAGRGQSILGFWHSHPDAAAVLSERDRIGAWPHALQIVVPVTPAGMSMPRIYRGLDADWNEIAEFEISHP